MEYPPVKPHHILLHELRKDLNYDKFKESLPQLLKLAGNDSAAKLEVYYYYYDAFAAIGCKTDVADIVKSIYEIPADNVESRILSLLIQARDNRSAKKFQLAEAQIDEAISLNSHQTGDLYFLTLRIKAGLCTRLERFDDGIKICREIIQHAEGNLVETFGAAYNSLGNIYITLQNDSEAEVNYHSAFKHFDQLGYRRDKAGVYSNLGDIQRYRFDRYEGDNEDVKEQYIRESIKYYLAALDTLGSSSETGYKLITLGRLSEIYGLSKNYQESIKYGKEALRLAKLTTYSGRIQQALISLGKTLNMAGQYQESLHYFEQAIPYFESLQKLEPEAELYELLSSICLRLGLFEKGLQYALKYTDLLKQFNEKAKAGIVYHNKALLEEVHRHENEVHQFHLKAIEEKMQSQAAQLVTQTELLAKFRDELREIARKHPSTDPDWREVKEKLKELPCKSIDWEKFETEFKAVHPEFTHKLYERFPDLTPTEMKMCSLLRLNLKSQRSPGSFAFRSVASRRTASIFAGNCSSAASRV